MPPHPRGPLGGFPATKARVPSWEHSSHSILCGCFHWPLASLQPPFSTTTTIIHRFLHSQLSFKET